MGRKLFTVVGVCTFLLIPFLSPSTSTAQSTLNLNSNPPGVSVSRAGERIGTTPVSVAIGSSAGDLSMAGSGFDWRSSVAANGDLSMTVNLDSTKEDPPYRVLVLSNPNKAEVVVDGELKSRTPWTGNLSPGEHTLELRKEGLKTWAATIDVRSGFSLTGNLNTVVESKSDDSGQSENKRDKDRVKADTTGEELVEPVEDKVKLVMPLGKDQPDQDWGQTKTPTEEKKSEAKDTKTTRNKETDQPEQKDVQDAESTMAKKSEANTEPKQTKPDKKRTKEEKEQAEKRAMEKRKRQKTKPPSTVPLTIESNPAGAGLFVDGEKIGATPFVKKDFSSGTTTIKLEKEGFRDWEETFHLDEPTQLTVKMKPIWSYLTVRPDPVNMNIKIADREFQLDGKRTFKVRPGEYEVRGRTDELGSSAKTVSLTKGETETVDLALEFEPKPWEYDTTRDVFLRMAQKNLGQLVSDFGIEAGQRLQVVSEHDDWAHSLMNDVLSVVMNRNAILVVDNPASRKDGGALDREFKFYIVEMDVQYESDGEEAGVKWLKRHFDLKVNAQLIRHETGEVQFTKFFRQTTSDRIPASLKDELRVPYEPPNTEPPL